MVRLVIYIIEERKVAMIEYRACLVQNGKGTRCNGLGTGYDDFYRPTREVHEKWVLAFDSLKRELYTPGGHVFFALARQGRNDTAWLTFGLKDEVTQEEVINYYFGSPSENDGALLGVGEIINRDARTWLIKDGITYPGQVFDSSQYREDPRLFFIRHVVTLTLTRIFCEIKVLKAHWNQK